MKQSSQTGPLRSAHYLFRTITGLALAALAVVFIFIYVYAPGNQGFLSLSIALLAGVIACYGALMLYVLFSKYLKYRSAKTAPKQLKEAEDALLMEGFKLGLVVVVTAMVALIPAFVMGVYAADDMSTGGIATLLYLVIFMSVLAGPLIAVGVLLPISLFIRSSIALIKGDTSKLPQFYTSLIIATLVALIITGGLAINPDHDGIGGWLPVVFAILGIPGAYFIKDEALLWVARGIVVVLVVVWIAARRSAKETKKIKDSQKSKSKE